MACEHETYTMMVVGDAHPRCSIQTFPNPAPDRGESPIKPWLDAVLAADLIAQTGGPARLSRFDPDRQGDSVDPADGWQ